MLNAALASEIIFVLRYKQHYYMTTSIHQDQLQGLFKEHWLDEEKQLELIADRIKTTRRCPGFNPNDFASEPFHPSRAATPFGFFVKICRRTRRN